MDTWRIDELISMFSEAASAASLFGMKLSFTDDAIAIIDLPVNPHLDHSSGGVHGGVYATMLDGAGWFTAAAVPDTPFGLLHPIHPSTFSNPCRRPPCVRLVGCRRLESARS